MTVRLSAFLRSRADFAPVPVDLAASTAPQKGARSSGDLAEVGTSLRIIGEPLSEVPNLLGVANPVDLAPDGPATSLDRRPPSHLGATRAGRDQLRAAIREFLQITDDRLLEDLARDLPLVTLRAGDPLIEQGDRSEHLFLVVNGRLRAIRGNGNRVEVLGDIERGQMVGELALVMGEARSATVVAVRDSLVARISRATFERITASCPEVGLCAMRTVVQRFRRAQTPRPARARRVTLCLLPVTGGLDLEGLARRMEAAATRLGDTAQMLGRADFEGFPRRDREDRDPSGRVAQWLDAAEAGTTALLLVADAGPSAWTDTCLRRADEVLLIADADATPRISPAEACLLDGHDAVIRPKQTLVLLHRADKRSPSETAAWLDRRPVERHLHIRPERAEDIQRLARLVTGRGIGIVLSGGGARGIAHVGVLNALAQAGIEIDVIGGTSIGAAIGGLRAMDLTGEALTRAARRIFVESGNPTGDYNLLPLISLVKGQRTRRITERAVREVAGQEIGLEDTWTSYFCVAGNYSTASEAVLTRGSISKALLASIAIPGALPPVIIGNHLYVDGGTVNNLPVDVLERYGVDKLLAVDLLSDRARTAKLDWIPGTAALLMDRLRPRAKRRYNLPGLPEILLNASVLQSMNRQREMRARADICFRPRLNRVRLLDWHKFDAVVQDSFESASRDLSKMEPARLASLRP